MYKSKRMMDVLKMGAVGIPLVFAFACSGNYKDTKAENPIYVSPINDMKENVYAKGKMLAELDKALGGEVKSFQAE